MLIEQWSFIVGRGSRLGASEVACAVAATVVNTYGTIIIIVCACA
jgi:hypothetical protein